MGSCSFENLNLDGGLGVKNEDSVYRGCAPDLGLDPEQIASGQLEESGDANDMAVAFRCGT